MNKKPAVLRRFKCLRHGHRWATVSVIPQPYGAMEYTDKCVQCSKERKEWVQEH